MTSEPPAELGAYRAWRTQMRAMGYPTRRGVHLSTVAITATNETESLRYWQAALRDLEDAMPLTVRTAQRWLDREKRLAGLTHARRRSIRR